MGVSNRQKVQFNLGRKVMQYVITLTLDDRVLIDMVGLESYTTPTFRNILSSTSRAQKASMYLVLFSL